MSRRRERCRERPDAERELSFAETKESEPKGRVVAFPVAPNYRAPLRRRRLAPVSTRSDDASRRSTAFLSNDSLMLYYFARSTKTRRDEAMIHRFSVSNYGSIRDEVTLDLRVPGTAPDLPCFRRSVAKPDVRLPAVAVIMGPNGSGKTTLLRALVGVIRFASILHQPSLRLLPFFSQETEADPTRFRLEGEWDALAPGENPGLFRYELAVRPVQTKGLVSSQVICHEALFHFPKGRPRRLFERGDPGTPIYVAREFGITPSDDRLSAVRADASVLATLDLLNVGLANEIVERLQGWLGGTNIVGHATHSVGTSTTISLLEESPAVHDWVAEQIKCSDLGIGGLRILPVAGSKQVMFDHSGLDRPVHLDFESSGTQRLFHLLPQLKFALDQTGLAIHDEIDGYLHVDIVSEILGWFRSRKSNPNKAQLLVTSHHVGLLDDLEKEEVFIVEKDDTGATRVHGAQDVTGLRRDARLYPKYRAGVLGGLPRIG